MRLVFKQNIIEKIDCAIADAKSRLKQIDYIELTLEEYYEVRKLLNITGRPQKLYLLGYEVRIKD